MHYEQGLLLASRPHSICKAQSVPNPVLVVVVDVGVLMLPCPALCKQSRLQMDSTSPLPTRQQSISLTHKLRLSFLSLQRSHRCSGSSLGVIWG